MDKVSFEHFVTVWIFGDVHRFGPGILEEEEKLWQLWVLVLREGIFKLWKWLFFILMDIH